MRRSLAVTSVLAMATMGLLGVGSAHATSEQQVMVRFEQRAATGPLLRALGARPVAKVYGTDVLVVRGPGASAESLAAALERSPLVDYAEPDGVLTVWMDPPDDPRFSSQYALERVNAVQGWSHYPGSYTGEGPVTIAVLDTGVDSRHEDLVGRVDTAGSRCFLTFLVCLGGYEDDHGHGTHVSGIAAASTNNGRGIAGVAYNTKIMALKVCDLLGSCSFSAVASAVNWATERGAKVVNMSLGGSSGSTTLQSALQNAHSAGVVLVAAAGNSGNTSTSYPAGYPQVISVAATTSSDEHASYSNRNNTVELSAPGSGVVSTYPGGYRSLSGTSMASPHVAGLAALLAGQNPGWSNEDIRTRMRTCADDLGPPGYDTSFGHGRVNAGRTLGSC